MEIPYASLKDLRSTGYFFDELKSYPESPDMDLTTYCVSFVGPYLVKVSESYDKFGKYDKSRILKLAIQHLTNPQDSEIIDLIFGLRKVAVSEADKAEKAYFAEQLDKSLSWINRQKMESAEFLVKLLVNIIKLFRLAESKSGLPKTDGIKNPVFEAIIVNWGILENKSS